MTQEQILYDVRLTQSSSKHILIVEADMDNIDKKADIPAEPTTKEEVVVRQAPQTIEDVVISFTQQLEKKPNIADWSDHELKKMLQSLQTVSTKVDPEKQEELKRTLDRQQQQLIEQMQERGIAQREGQFDEQLAEKWVETVGDELKIQREVDAKVEVKVVNGEEILVLPEKLTLADVIEAARALGLVEGTAEKMQSFAKQLKDATFFLARQKNEKGDSIFDDGVLTYLYDYAEQLRVLATGNGEVQKKTADEIRKESEKADLLPEYFEKNLEAIQHHGGKEKMQEDYENHLFLFLLGKNHTTVQIKDGEVAKSFYDRVRERWYRRREQGRKNPESFEEWLINRKKLFLSMFADYVNNGRIYANENTQTGLSEETQTRGQQSIFEAISQRGKEKRKRIQIKALEKKPEIQEQVGDILNPKVDAQKVAALATNAEIIRDSGGPKDVQFAKINELVLDAYGLKTEAKNARYSISDALVQGEFGCSIQTLLMADLLKETYGDDLMLMADTTISGNIENELSGHIRLVAIDKHTGEGYFVDTHTGNTNGFERVTDISRITDRDFVKKAQEAYVKAQTFTEGDFNISVALAKKKTVNETDDKKMEAYEVNHNLTSVNLGIESAIWNNLAATAEPEVDEAGKKEDAAQLRERKIHMVERALALNPSNAIAWAQLANLNEGDSTRHNAFLQKAQAIDSAVQIHPEDTFTIDKYEPSPPLTLTNPKVKAIYDDINRQLNSINPNAQLTDLSDRDLGTLMRKIEMASEDSTVQTDQNAQNDLAEIAQDIQDSATQMEKEMSYFSQFTTLTAEDRRQILRSPEEWLQSQFDNLYRVVKPGQILENPLLGVLQNNYNDAARAISSRYGDTNPDLVKRFNSIFTLRLYAAVGRSTLDERKIKEVGGAIGKMGGIDGVFEAMTLDGGRVEQMYRFLATRLDAERLAQGGPERRLRPDVIFAIQEDIIDTTLGSGVKVTGGPEEYEKIYKVGVGDYSRIYEDYLDKLTRPTRLTQRDGDYVEQIYKGYIARYKEVKNVRDIPLEEETKLREKAQQKVAMERTRQDITRSVRLAYDLLVITARDAVIAARGNPSPEDLERYRSDPTGVNAYNLESFLFGKFGIHMHEEKEFLDYTKREIATNELMFNRGKSKKQIEQMDESDIMDLGTALLKDLYAVPDFYSSGWRVEGMLEALTDQIGTQKAQNLGLLIQLRFGSNYWYTGNPDKESDEYKANHGKGFRENMWKKIAVHTPDEIVKLFRERYGGGTTTNSEREKITQPNYHPFTELMNNAVFKPSVEYQDTDYRSEAEYRFDMFMQKYDPVIAQIRKNHLENYEQVDWTHLTDRDKEYIGKYFDDPQEVGRLQEAFRLMTQFSTAEKGEVTPYDEEGHEKDSYKTDGAIAMLMGDTKFIDIYTRTRRVDDMPLGILQQSGKLSERMARLAPVGAKLASQIGNDALIRSWSDTGVALDANGDLLKFFTEGPIGDHGFEEKIKAAGDFAKKVEAYNGPNAEAEMNRALMGSLIMSTERNKILDYLGIDHLPFQQPISTSQEIFGPAAKSLSRRDINVLLYQLGEKMVTSGHSKEDADKIIKQLRERLGVTKLDMIKMQIVTMIILFLMASVVTVQETTDLKGMTSGK